MYEVDDVEPDRQVVFLIKYPEVVPLRESSGIEVVLEDEIVLVRSYLNQ